MNDEQFNRIMSLLEMIATNLRDLNTLAERRERDAQRKWTKRHQKCLRTDECPRTKEEEGKGKEKSPHTPLKGKGSEEEERAHEIRAREEGVSTPDAGIAEEPLPPVIDPTKLPTLDEVLHFAHRRYGLHDDKVVRDWYDKMQNVYQWHDTQGRKIGNWCGYLAYWMSMEPFFKKQRDPERLPDARRPGPAQSRRKADNWRGTPKEDIEDVL